MTLAYIDDGCTEFAFFRAEHNLYDEVRVEFRPFTAAEKHSLTQRLRKVVDNGENYVALVATELEKKLFAWNITDRDGKPWAITPAHIAKLKTELQARLFSLVLGEHGGDKDPNDSPELWSSKYMGGKPDKLEEAREKNSEAA